MKRITNLVKRIRDSHSAHSTSFGMVRLHFLYYWWPLMTGGRGRVWIFYCPSVCLRAEKLLDICLENFVYLFLHIFFFFLATLQKLSIEWKLESGCPFPFLGVSLSPSVKWKQTDGQYVNRRAFFSLASHLLLNKDFH